MKTIPKPETGEYAPYAMMYIGIFSTITLENGRTPTINPNCLILEKSSVSVEKHLYSKVTLEKVRRN